MNKIRLVSLLSFTLLSGAAAAQTGLTLYGNIDASWVNSTGIGPGNDRRSSFGEGNWTPSLWGISGKEDLGSGVMAHINLEGGFNAGDGSIANGGTTGVFSRQANVGFSGDFGAFKAGLQISPFIAAYNSSLAIAGQNFSIPALLLHQNGTALNNLGAPVSVANGGIDADVASGTTGGFFIPNSISYSLPKELLGGFTGSAMYGFGGVPGDTGANRFASGNLGYSLGDINLLAAISDRAQQYQQYLLGGSVPLGAAKLAGSYVHFRPETGGSTNTYIIGAGLQIMPKTNVGINFARNSGTNHPSIINLSAVYSASKSTELYVAFNHAKDGAFSSYSGAVDATANPAAYSQTVSISNAFILGLRKGF